MKKIVKHITTIILMFFLIQPAFGFAGMLDEGENSGIDLANATESDQGIILLQQLIEVDTIQLASENKIFVRETLIYRNEGTQNFSGFLRTWVPDGAEELRIARVEMIMEGRLQAMQAVQDGNVISWQDYMKAKDPLPPLYIVEYIIPAVPQGTIQETQTFDKKFIYPTLLTKQPYSVILKIIKTEENKIKITDETGNNIVSSGNPRNEDNAVLYGWEMTRFKGINVEVTKPAFTSTRIITYAVLGLIILVILAYPGLRKNNQKLREFEEKIKEYLRREPDETEIIEKEEGIESPEQVEVDRGLSGKTKDELVTEKNDILARLSELEKKYATGDLLDEEYEELHSSYQDKIDRITRRLNELPASSAITSEKTEKTDEELSRLDKLYRDHAVGKISYKEFKQLKRSYEETGSSGDATSSVGGTGSSGVTDEKTEILSKLDDLYRDHAIGKISYKEYKKLLRSYDEKLEKL